MNHYKNQNSFYKIFNFILDLIFPKECAGCGKEDVFLCAECIKKIDLPNHKTCPICEKTSALGSTCAECKKNHYLDGLYAASDYNNPIIRAAIKTLKFKFVEEMHIPLADLIVKFVGAENFQPLQKFDLIIPVPLHKKRLAWRGFNQSEMIASRLSEYFKIPINRDCLIKIKNTPPQSKTKNQKEREENIKGAFIIHGGCLALLGSPAILLVDDVCSTASTLDECARILKLAGAKKVWGCVAARGR